MNDEIPDSHTPIMYYSTLFLICIKWAIEMVDTDLDIRQIIADV